ncbi:MAG: tRNA 2-thiouridine(34) synthase MnmA [Bacteroidales bacterium]|nr:tRNA 2-thiouridine(34) synthase MnmA [Bacteroidales bacterium]
MSGGVDSSVAAILLQQQGYEVVGVTFRLWDAVSDSCIDNKKGYSAVEALEEVEELAAQLEIEHHFLDYRDLFRRTVIQNFADEYLNGRTPNPCALCNRIIKWGEMIQFAEKMDCQLIATGHYAAIGKENGHYFIQKGKDEFKDQSYFLWQLSQNALSKTIFPLGNFDKKKIREMAAENSFGKIAVKNDSQELCFVPDNNYRHFLKDNVPEISKIDEGQFVSVNGKFLGKNAGYYHFTIGQRKGLGIALGYPAFVVKIDAKKNTVTLGRKEDLMKMECMLSDWNLMKYARWEGEKCLETKIRYRSKPVKSRVFFDGQKIKVIFDKPVSAITPGQNAVFYEGNDVVGGGIIDND